MKPQLWKAMVAPWAAVASILAAPAMYTQASAVPTKDSGFVQVQGGHFTLNGKPFYFAGTNNYYLNYDSNAMIDDVLTKAQKMGLKVVRMWGFLDGVTENGDISMQPTLGHYDPSGFERMDYAVAEAQKLGLKLVITLVNNWNDFGGMQQYVDWVEGPKGNHDDFYTNPNIIQAYENYVKYLITRKNSITGVEYRNDPTIMAWDLANEPEDKSDPSGKTITAWASKVSTFIHHLDPNHLIALGDEGWFSSTDPQASVDPASYTQNNGVNWDAILKLPYISYGTYHMYPESWGSTAAWGNKWITAHINAARADGKPAVLEEYGEQDASAQPGVYQNWINTVLKDRGAGEMFWMLSGNMDNGQPYPNYDGYGVYYPSKLADVLAYGATQMDKLSAGKQPAVIVPQSFDQTAPTKGATGVSVTPKLTWDPAIGADEYHLVVSANADFSDPVIDNTLHSTDYQPASMLTPSTMYYWKVIAISPIGQTAATQAGEPFTTEALNLKVTPFETFDEYANNAALQANFTANSSGTPPTITLDQQHDVQSGSNSLKVSFNVPAGGYAGEGEALKDLNWNGFKGIQFWVQTTDSTHSVSLQFQTKGGQYWEDDHVTLKDTTQPQLVQVPFSDFSPPTWNTGNTGILNLGDIIQFSLFFGGSGNSTMYFDSFEVYP